MYRVAVRSRFSAAHRLLLANGSYEPPHGHDWSVEARFAGTQLDPCGMLIDFERVRAALGGVLEGLHHTDLNAAPLLAGLNPSAENVARVVCDALARTLPCPDLLESVSVEEAPGCTATYWPPGRAAGSEPPRSVDAAKPDR